MFLEAVSEEVAARLNSAEAQGTQWSRQHLANLLWAYATLDLHPGARMMAAVVEASTPASPPGIESQHQLDSPITHT